MATSRTHRASLLPLPTAPVHRPWLVIFVDPVWPGRGRRFRDRVLLRFLARLRPGFRHVMAISPEGTGHRWLVVNPASDMLAVGLLDSTGVIPELRAAVAGGRAHVVAVTGRQPTGWRFRGLFSCVATIAHLTGAPAGPFTTPWRLYRRLTAR